MALNRKKKEEVLAEAKDLVSNSNTVVFVAFSGLSVSESSELRDSLRESDSGLKVIKKTLLKRALDEAGVKGESPSLPGEIAISFGEDMVMPAKAVSVFGKNYEDKVKIVGGIVEGEYKSAEDMNELASIPGHKELYGMFVNVINSPITGLVISLDAIAKNKEQ